MGCMKMKEQLICEHCGFDGQMENEPHQLPMGTVVGEQYILGRVLSESYMEIDYLGWDTCLACPVTVREFYCKSKASGVGRGIDESDRMNAGMAAFREDFEAEGEKLIRVWHVPQVLRILRDFRENGTSYKVYEYAEGVNLRKYIESRGYLNWEQTMALLTPIRDGLVKIHEAGLVHRCIRPETVLVLKDGSVKLVEFENAIEIGSLHDGQRLNMPSDGFMPLELMRADHVNLPSMDVFGLCGLFYYCLTGMKPMSCIDRVMHDGNGISWGVVPDVDVRRPSVLERGMALRAKERYDTVEELWEFLTSDRLYDPFGI